MNDYVKNVCKLGQGKPCCRYLIVGYKGFECAKLTHLKLTLDAKVEENTMTAQGDNCDGFTTEVSMTKLNHDEGKETTTRIGSQGDQGSPTLH